MERTDVEEYQVFQNIEDLQVYFSINQLGEYTLKFSRPGIKSDIKFHSDEFHIGKLTREFKKISTVLPNQYFYKCSNCGEKIDIRKLPTNCCSSQSLEYQGSELPISRSAGKLTITVFDDDEEIVLEIGHMEKSQKEVFTGLRTHLKDLFGIFKEMTANYNQFQQEMREANKRDEKIEEASNLIRDEIGVDESEEITKVQELMFEELGVTEDESKDIISRLKRNGELFEPEQGRIQYI